MAYGESDHYTFIQDEYELALKLFSNLQKEITSARNFPDQTRSKIFEKLEDMILQMDLCVDDLDTFWSFIARAEIAYKVYEGGIIPQALKELCRFDLEGTMPC